MGKLTWFLFTWIMYPFVAMWQGFVLIQLWQWFVVPTFDLDPLRVIEAIGVMLIVSFFRVMKYESEEEANTDVVRKRIFYVVAVIIIPTTTLLFGFLFSRFM